MDSPSFQPLTEEEACVYAEWVHLHTGYQTMVCSQPWRGDTPIWSVCVVNDRGTKFWLYSRRKVACFVNGREGVGVMAQEQGTELAAERVHRLAQAIRDSDDSGEILDLSHQLREASGALAKEIAQEFARLRRERDEADDTAGARLREITWLRTELADCTRDCRKAGERFEKALDLLCDVAVFFEDNQRGVTAEEMQLKVRAYLDSE